MGFFIYNETLTGGNSMNITRQNPGEWSSRDIYLSTVLKQSGVQILRVENKTGRGIFVFQGSPEIEGIIADYFNGNLKVDPRGLFDTWKALKSMAFSAVDNVR